TRSPRIRSANSLIDPEDLDVFHDTSARPNTPKSTDSCGRCDLNHPGFRSVLQARMEPMNQKYSPEMRERALRMLDEAKPEHPHLMAAVRHVAGLLGISPVALRVWHRRREIDAGRRPGVPTDVAEENKRLRRENAELKKANEVLKAASVFFAKELDRP